MEKLIIFDWGGVIESHKPDEYNIYDAFISVVRRLGSTLNEEDIIKNIIFLEMLMVYLLVLLMTCILSKNGMIVFVMTFIYQIISSYLKKFTKKNFPKFIIIKK